MIVINGNEVFSWGNKTEALKYLGQEGYFSDVFRPNLEYWKESRLIGINPHHDCRVQDVFISSDNTKFGLFVPKSGTKTTGYMSDTWRPFVNFKECTTTLGLDVGSVVTMRPKGMPNLRFTSVILSAGEGLEKEDLVEIGTGLHTLSLWFKTIEIWNANKWQPFGVCEND